MLSYVVYWKYTSQFKLFSDPCDAILLLVFHQENSISYSGIYLHLMKHGFNSPKLPRTENPYSKLSTKHSELRSQGCAPNYCSAAGLSVDRKHSYMPSYDIEEELHRKCCFFIECNLLQTSSKRNVFWGDETLYGF